MRASSDLKFPEESDSDSDDTLSLRDLPLQNDAVSKTLPQPTPDDSDVFEFAFVGRSKSTAPVRSQDPFSYRSESFTGKRVVSRSSRHGKAFPGSWPSPGNLGARHKVVFGVAKIPAEMELSSMRKRQSRRAPPPMFPTAAAVDVTGGGGGSFVRCGARFASALARAFMGCMRLV